MPVRLRRTCPLWACALAGFVWAAGLTVGGSARASGRATTSRVTAGSHADACGRLSARRSHPAIVSLDPARGAPRIFAMQYKQAAANVVSYASFRTKIDCMLRTYVLPHLARGRPNVVVFNEDVGLATLGIGSRGAAARKLVARPNCHPDLCGALGTLSDLTTAYARPLAAYRARFPTLNGLSEGFVAGIDTIVRGFMGTFSALAKHYHLYMIGSGPITPFHQSGRARDIRTFADPDLSPAPRSVYVASSTAVYNEVLMWGPRNVRVHGPDVLRNVVSSNLKVPLTALELALGFQPGPARGRAAVANLRPFKLPGTRARLGFATSLPAFTYGNPPPGTDPCADTSRYYMRCLDKLGANLVIQDEANPGRWTGPDGNGIEQWQPLSWMSSTYRTIADPNVRFDYNVTAMMVGNLSDLAFDGQSAITQRGQLGRTGRRCHYIGNASFIPGEDQPVFRRYAGFKPQFLVLAPWVVRDASRSALRHVGAALAAGSGSALENDYLETALVADLPSPPDARRANCVGAAG